MMHLLRKYDVATLRSASDAMFAQCAVRHTSLGVTVIICRGQTSFKKVQFVGEEMMHRLWRYDVMLSHNDIARITRNDAMFAIKCGEATHHSRSEHHWQRQHHLPKANIIQKSHLCLDRQK